MYLAQSINYRDANLTGLYLLNRTTHRHKLFTKRFISGTLFYIPSYTRIPYSDARRERVKVQCQVFNYRIGYFIIGFPLLAILQLSEASNTTAHHPSIV